MRIFNFLFFYVFGTCEATLGVKFCRTGSSRHHQQNRITEGRQFYGLRARFYAALCSAHSMQIGLRYLRRFDILLFRVIENIRQMAFPAILTIMHRGHEDTCSALCPKLAPCPPTQNKTSLTHLRRRTLPP